MTIHEALTKKEGRGLASFEDGVKSIKRSKRKLITEASSSSDNIRTNRATITKKQKQLYRYFKQQPGEISPKKTWT